jgi:hypothetical protein
MRRAFHATGVETGNELAVDPFGANSREDRP